MAADQERRSVAHAVGVAADQERRSVAHAVGMADVAFAAVVAVAVAAVVAVAFAAVVAVASAAVVAAVLALGEVVAFFASFDGTCLQVGPCLEAGLGAG